MYVFYATDNLSEVELCLLLCDLIVLDEVVELSFGGELHDDENVVGCVQYLVEFDDIRVVDEF
jgi:hypothetical protein